MNIRFSATLGSQGLQEILDRKRAFLFYLVAEIWLIAWFYYGYGYWEDDAFIHLEFARNLFEGRGFSFTGIVVYGDTSPLWVFLLAGALPDF